MTKNLDKRKYRLIEEIIKLDNEADLSKLESQLELLRQQEDLSFMEAIKPIRASVTLDQLIVEQNYTPITKGAFFQKTSELEFEESLEELLSMLD